MQVKRTSAMASGDPPNSNDSLMVAGVVIITIKALAVGDLPILLLHGIRQAAFERQRALQRLRAGRAAGGMVAQAGIEMPGIDQQMTTEGSAVHAERPSGGGLGASGGGLRET